MASATPITTVSATRGTPVQSGLVVDDEDASVYELGLPNAAKTSGRWVIISWSGTGILADSMLFDLIALDRWNSQTAGLDAMADLLDDGRIDLLIDGLVTGVTVSAIDEDAITAAALAAGAVTEIQSGLSRFNVASDTVDIGKVAGTSVSDVSDLKADVSGLATTTELTKAVDRSGYVLAILAGAISSAGTATETFDITLDGVAHRAVVEGLDTDGNRI